MEIFEQGYKLKNKLENKYNHTHTQEQTHHASADALRQNNTESGVYSPTVVVCLQQVQPVPQQEVVEVHLGVPRVLLGGTVEEDVEESRLRATLAPPTNRNSSRPHRISKIFGCLHCARIDNSRTEWDSHDDTLHVLQAHLRLDVRQVLVGRPLHPETVANRA